MQQSGGRGTQREGRRVQAVGYRDQEARGRGRGGGERGEKKKSCMQTSNRQDDAGSTKQADRTIDALPADRR